MESVFSHELTSSVRARSTSTLLWMELWNALWLVICCSTAAKSSPHDDVSISRCSQTHARTLNKQHFTLYICTFISSWNWAKKCMMRMFRQSTKIQLQPTTNHVASKLNHSYYNDQRSLHWKIVVFCSICSGLSRSSLRPSQKDRLGSSADVCFSLTLTSLTGGSAISAVSVVLLTPAGVWGILGF